jgi:hypothetical protein
MGQGSDRQATDHRFIWELYADTTALLTRHGYRSAGTVSSYGHTTTLLGWLAAAYEGRHFDPEILSAEWGKVHTP